VPWGDGHEMGGGTATRKRSDAWDRQPIFPFSTLLRLFSPDEEVPYPSVLNDLEDALLR
jgi:hypothetical protein